MADPRCGYCDHPLSEHCPGGVKHGSPKEQMWPESARRRTNICHTRHCLNPLCDCTGFVDQKRKAT